MPEAFGATVHPADIHHPITRSVGREHQQPRRRHRRHAETMAPSARSRPARPGRASTARGSSTALWPGRGRRRPGRDADTVMFCFPRASAPRGIDAGRLRPHRPRSTHTRCWAAAWGGWESSRRQRCSPWRSTASRDRTKAAALTRGIEASMAWSSRCTRCRPTWSTSGPRPQWPSTKLAAALCDAGVLCFDVQADVRSCAIMTPSEHIPLAIERIAGRRWLTSRQVRASARPKRADAANY